jgi:putative flippase GtrA
VASAVGNYTLNRRFTFRSDVDYLAGLKRFGIIAGGGLALNAIVMAAGTDLAGMNYLASQLVATAVVLLWNFHANRLWTFTTNLSDSRKSTQEDSPLTGSCHDQERPSDAARQ